MGVFFGVNREMTAVRPDQGGKWHPNPTDSTDFLFSPMTPRDFSKPFLPTNQEQTKPKPRTM